MATGYTHPVVDGSVTEFPEFAMQCARAFGALISMRDEPMDAEIPEEFRPSDYSAKKLAEMESKLAKLEAMTSVEAQQGADENYTTRLNAHLEYRAKMKLENERLEAMIHRVRDWVPPTKDHREMKKFMLEQLTSSLHDMKWGSEEPVRLTAAAWWAEEIASARREVAYYSRQDADERKRAAERTEWVRQLRASLTAPDRAA